MHCRWSVGKLNKMRRVSNSQDGKGCGPTATSDASEGCARWEPRESVNRRAQITLEGQVTALPCRMLNQSSSGAMIEMDGAEAVAMRQASYSGMIHLHMLHDRAEVACRMAWQQGPRLGLRFVAPIRSLPKPAQRSAQAKRSPQKSVFGRWLSA